MVIGSLLTAFLALGQTAAAAAAPPQPSPCLQGLSNGVDVAHGELCAGEESVRLAGSNPKNSQARTRHLEDAASHFRRAVNLAADSRTGGAALNLLAQTYDGEHLDDAAQMEQVLRELTGLVPDDLTPLYRIAKLQEDRGLIDAAEITLLDARHRMPDTEQPNRMLAQFYARRVTALHKRDEQPTARNTSNPGEPDANGVYRIGDSLKPPSRADVPQYPPDAQAAGIRGVVVAEVTIDPSGNVAAARIVESIPLLDEAALQAVRNWRFAPTIVNGEAVPVKMNVTVNFSLPPVPAARQPGK